MNRFIERVLPWIVLSLILLYTYVQFFTIPYLGLSLYLSTGEVIWVLDAASAPIEKGDIILAVNGVPIADVAERLWSASPLLKDLQADNTISIQIRKQNDQIVEHQWIIPGMTAGELITRLAEYWWLALVFWAAGTATALFLRPKDLRWRLLVLFYFVTAIWLSAGVVGSWSFWGSFAVYVTAVWLAVPLYFHLHWIFPTPLGRLPSWLLVAAYGVALVAIAATLLQAIDYRAYYLAALLAILLPPILMIARYWLQPQAHRGVRLLLMGLLLSFMPMLAAMGLQALGFQALYVFFGLLGLPLLPLTYFYVSYRYQLGAMELRANRLIARYLFVCTLLLGIPLITLLANRLFYLAEDNHLFSLILATTTGLLGAIVFPSFQRMVDSRLLGVTMPSQDLLRLYAEQIASTSDLQTLAAVLRDRVMPSLLVRRSALYRLEDSGLVVVYEERIDEDMRPQWMDIVRLTTAANRYHAAEVDDSWPGCCKWVRVVLPLQLNDETIALWLLGRRDPDDFYAQMEIEILQVLAQQTVVALKNILQAEQLRLIYEANVQRQEVERRQLALTLHDEVLNRQAQLLWELAPDALTPEIEAIYRGQTRTIRQIINELRPAMLQYGLLVALEELTDNMAARRSALPIRLDLHGEDARYDAKTEEHIFRIVQQALENALRHSNASEITVSGALSAESGRIVVADDGDGFDVQKMDMSRLLANERFGLVGMRERAALAGVRLQIHSVPGQGTQIAVRWGS